MYVVKKPLNLAGRRRHVGERVSDREVLRAKPLMRSGYLVHVEEQPLQPNVVEGATAAINRPKRTQKSKGDV